MFAGKLRSSEAASFDPLTFFGFSFFGIQAIYGIPTTAATHTTNRLGVSGFIEQFANEADLTVCPTCRCYCALIDFGVVIGIPDQLP